MKANVLYGINDLRFTDYPLPKLRPGWVLVKVRAAGICGSDVARVFKNGTYHFPTIIGHEFSGEVVETFDGDNELRHRNYAIFPLIPCMQCDSCKAGRYETCLNYNYLGSRCDGGFAEYAAVPQWNLLPLPENISMESAAMFEPASVALHAIRRIGLNPGESIAIIGPGSIGCIMVQLALLCGANKIIVIGRTQSKLEFIYKNYGVDIVNSAENEAIDKISSMTDGKGVDVVIEGTGASQSLNLGLEIVKAFGRILTLGNPLSDIELEKNAYWKILRKQLNIIGTWNSSFGTDGSDWTSIRELVSKGHLLLDQLITHKFPLSDLSQGLEVITNRNVYSNKVMIINE